MSERVVEAARSCGLEVEVHRLESAPRTVADAASAVSCPTEAIARSRVYVVDGDPVVCLTAGDAEPDPELVCDLLDAAEARTATPAEARAATGFPLASVPPLAHGLRTLVDASLVAQQRIWAAGGDGRTLVELDPRALVEGTGATVAPIARRREPVC
jgi:prolyl-tRNA editing enzyme YbaK/EbsC (Cys-tRNA(Pro) deacylase)